MERRSFGGIEVVAFVGRYEIQLRSVGQLSSFLDHVAAVDHFGFQRLHLGQTTILLPYRD